MGVRGSARPGLEGKLLYGVPGRAAPGVHIAGFLPRGHGLPLTVPTLPSDSQAGCPPWAWLHPAQENAGRGQERTPLSGMLLCGGCCLRSWGPRRDSILGLEGAHLTPVPCPGCWEVVWQRGLCPIREQRSSPKVARPSAEALP